MNKKINITPFRMIRIVNNLTLDEMASYFGVTGAYISAAEKNERKFRVQTLNYGLIRLGISEDDYLELQQFSENLLNQELSDNDKYKFMLLKTLGIFNPNMKKEIENLIGAHCKASINKQKCLK